MTFDFAEVFTVAARHAVPLVRAKGLLFSYDCEVEGLSFLGAPAALQGGVHRLVCALTETLQTGYVLIVARPVQSHDGGWQVQINLGGVGTCDPAAMAIAARKLDMYLSSPPEHALIPEYSARGVCPLTAGEVGLHCVLNQGVLLSLQLPAQAPAAPPVARPNARGARVWLVNVDTVLAAAWTRRLHRFGWAVSRLDSCDAGLAQLTAQPHAARPALVLALERHGPRADCSPDLAAALPPSAQLIYAVPAHSPILQEPLPVDGYDVRVYPFSPEDLAEFTRRAVAAEEPSGMTQPMPLASQDVALVLIVDDTPMNLLVGRGLTEALGYRVITAASGLEALALCKQDPPDAVLMDMQMPGMSGIDTVQTLRRQQSRGEVPPFPIVGLTASWSPEVRAQSMAAGMDDCIPKPTDVVQLAQELRRFSTMH